MKECDKELINEMMEFFNVKSMKGAAIALGYGKNTVNSWHTRGVTNAAKKRFELLKSHTMHSLSKMTNTSDKTQSKTKQTPSKESMQSEAVHSDNEELFNEVVNLLHLYASRAMLLRLKDQLEGAKNLLN